MRRPRTRKGGNRTRIAVHRPGSENGPGTGRPRGASSALQGGTWGGTTTPTDRMTRPAEPRRIVPYAKADRDVRRAKADRTAATPTPIVRTVAIMASSPDGACTG